MLTPSSHNYLIKRRQSYYYRRRVPVLLKAFFTGKEFVTSLQTKHFNDAKKLANRYDGYFDQLLYQEKLKNMDIDPSKIHSLIVKKNPDGSQSAELTPEHILAYSQAGLTPELIKQLALEVQDKMEAAQATQENTLQSDSISPRQPTNPNSSHTSPSKPLLSEVIKYYHDDLKTVISFINRYFCGA